jgi:hypothetical protein
MCGIKMRWKYEEKGQEMEILCEDYVGVYICVYLNSKQKKTMDESKWVGVGSNKKRLIKIIFQ